MPTQIRDNSDSRTARATSVVTETRPLAQVNEAMADVEAGRVPGRVVFDLRVDLNGS